MTPEQAMKIIKSLQNIAIQKGLFQNVEAVNQVTAAILVMDALATESKKVS